MAKTLTAKAVEKIKPGSVRREIPDKLTPGLYLVVQPSGKKGWAVRYRFGTRSRKFTLKGFPELAKARELARTALITVSQGRDPAVEARAANNPASNTVEDVLKDYIQKYARPRNRCWRDGARALGFKPDPDDDELLVRTGKGVLKAWDGRLIQSITKRDVLKMLDDIGAKYPIAANRRLVTLRRMFRWFVEKDVITTNPCDGISPQFTEQSRDRVLTDTEVKAVWRAAEAIGWPFGPIVQLLILTGCRREEVAAMHWTELDVKATTWTLPAGRTKNAKAKIVPLSQPAVAILEELPHVKSSQDFVFTTIGSASFSGFSKSKRKLDKLVLKEAPGCAPFVLHDLRRTIATGLQRLGTRLEVTEAVLGHVSGSRAGIVGIYQRHDWAAEKRQALEAWAQHVIALVSGGEKAKKVVNLNERRGKK
jgi:integrase